MSPISRPPQLPDREDKKYPLGSFVLTGFLLLGICVLIYLIFF